MREKKAYVTDQWVRYYREKLSKQEIRERLRYLQNNKNAGGSKFLREAKMSALRKLV